MEDVRSVFYCNTRNVILIMFCKGCRVNAVCPDTTSYNSQIRHFFPKVRLGIFRLAYLTPTQQSKSLFRNIQMQSFVGFLTTHLNNKTIHTHNVHFSYTASVLQDAYYENSETPSRVFFSLFCLYLLCTFFMLVFVPVLLQWQFRRVHL